MYELVCFLEDEEEDEEEDKEAVILSVGGVSRPLCCVLPFASDKSFRMYELIDTIAQGGNDDDDDENDGINPCLCVTLTGETFVFFGTDVFLFLATGTLSWTEFAAAVSKKAAGSASHRAAAARASCSCSKRPMYFCF